MSNYAAVRDCRRRLKYRCVEFLGGCCRMCGYRRCFRASQFHHATRESKTEALYKMIANNRPWPVIKRELEKCILLCANCHAEVEDAYDKKMVLVLSDGHPPMYVRIGTHEENVSGEQVQRWSGESICGESPHTTTRKPSRD